MWRVRAWSGRRDSPAIFDVQPDRLLITGGLTRAQRGPPRSSVSESDATSSPSSRAAAASISGSASRSPAARGSLSKEDRSAPPSSP